MSFPLFPSLSLDLDLDLLFSWLLDLDLFLLLERDRRRRSLDLDLVFLPLDLDLVFLPLDLDLRPLDLLRVFLPRDLDLVLRPLDLLLVRRLLGLLDLLLVLLCLSGGGTNIFLYTWDGSRLVLFALLRTTYPNLSSSKFPPDFSGLFCW